MATIKEQVGTAKVWRSSGGDGAITLASLANGSYREGAKIDFGATRAPKYAVYIDSEHAATPTAGNTLDLWLNPSSSGTAGTDNRGGCAGTDSAYAGYSSDAANSVKALCFVGSAVLAARATSTVQKTFVGFVSLPERYASIVLLNSAGSAFHSSDANCKITFLPIEGVSE